MYCDISGTSSLWTWQQLHVIAQPWRKDVWAHYITKKSYLAPYLTYIRVFLNRSRQFIRKHLVPLHSCISTIARKGTFPKDAADPQRVTSRRMARWKPEAAPLKSVCQLQVRNVCPIIRHDAFSRQFIVCSVCEYRHCSASLT